MSFCALYASKDWHYLMENINPERNLLLLRLDEMNPTGLRVSLHDWQGSEDAKFTKWTSIFHQKQDLKVAYDVHREIIENEIVIESDYPTFQENYEAARLIGAIIEDKGFKPLYYFSGNKSIHCLEANTQVFVKIKDKIKLTCLTEVHRKVQENKDEIFIHTHKGFVKIKESKIRWKEENENLIKIRVSDGQQIVCDAEHLFPIYHRGKYVLKKAKDITTKDLMFISLKKIDGNNKGTYDMGRFIGLYLAEGSKDKNSKVLQFTFDKSEDNLVDFIKMYSDMFGATYNIYRKDNYIKIHVNSRTLYYLIDEYCIGRVSKNKEFTNTVFGMSEEFRKGILNGWLEGDGNHNQYQDGVTISSGLAKSFLFLANSLGKRFSKHSYYRMNSYSNRKLRSYRLHEFKNPYLERSVFSHNLENCVLSRVKYIYKKCSKKTRLVDISVDSQDELFSLANGIVTHNCHVWLDFRCLLDLDSNLQDLIYGNYTKKKFIKEFMTWLRLKMASFWGVRARVSDEQVAGATRHLIRSELSLNKLGFKTLIGTSYKDLTWIPPLCTIQNKIMPKIGQITLSRPKDIQSIVEEFLASQEISKQTKKHTNKMKSLSNWLEGTPIDHNSLRKCVEFILKADARLKADGYNRGFFILFNELRRLYDPDKAKAIIENWNSELGFPIRQQNIDYRVNSPVYSLSCDYIHSYLKSCGFTEEEFNH